MGRKNFKLFILIGIILLFFPFCTNKSNSSLETIIEEVVEKYDQVDFSVYDKLELSVRERRIIRDAIGIYFLTDSLNNRWYANIINYGGIMTILNDKPYDILYKEYISDDSIKSLARSFVELDLDYLKVNGDYIFLSPRPFSFESAFMLKINDSVFVSNNKHLRIQGDGSFTHYKKNWYVSDFYIEKYDMKMNY